jgi:Na+-translocating ferredoxin:NAD+ oxidoreductase RNF subunit RnfB
MDTVIISALVLGGLGLVLGGGLAFASKKFAVFVDPRIEELMDTLPGANCGGCGYPGCSGYAEAVIKAGVKPTLCTPGGSDLARTIARIAGVEAGEVIPKRAIVQCRGGEREAQSRFDYEGIQDCSAAQLVGNGAKGCVYGCLGLGSCVRVCPYDALAMSDNGLPVVFEDKCTGCGICVGACPRGILALADNDVKVYLGCVSKDRGPKVKKICSAGCIGCTVCAKKGPEGVEMEGWLPRIDYEKVKDWPDANKVCPTKSFVIV